MNLRDWFNERKWRDDDLVSLEIDVVHRGAPGDRRTVLGGWIRSVAPTGLVLAPEAGLVEEEDEEAGEDVFLPYHRILEVRGPTGTVWTKP